jgi:hypothetical protein
MKSSLFGPIIGYGFKLISFCFLRSGKNITLMCHNDDCLDFYRTTSPCCWIVEHREGKRHFKFENMWLKSDGFVQRWWESYDFQGLPSYVLANKLKALKADLKKWNAEVFSDVGKRKKELLEGIKELEGFEESRGLVEEERV